MSRIWQTCPSKESYLTSLLLNNIDDFRSSVTSPTTPTNLPEEDKELPAEDNDPQPTVGCSEIESSSYLEPVDNCSIEHKLASLFLYMQTVLHISKSATQQIVE